MAASEADARDMAAEALGLALLTYLDQDQPLPLPRAKARGLVPITAEAEVSAKLAVIEASRDSGLSKAELGRRLDRDEREVRRILNPIHQAAYA